MYMTANLAIPVFEPAPAPAERALDTLFAGQSLEWCLWQMLYVVALRVLMVWVYNNIGRSLFAMDLLHPGFFVWWYLWPVDGTGLSIPSFYDPRNLAITAVLMAAVVTVLWGSRTLATFRPRWNSASRTRLPQFSSRPRRAWLRR